MRSIFIILAATLPCLAIADGFGGAEGINSLGQTVYISEAGVNEYELGAYYKSKPETLKKYKFFEECKYTQSEPYFFTCRNGDSPLAGATYKITTSKKWMPCKGSKEYPSEKAGTVYLCVKGCNKRTPKIFYENPWEC